MHSEVAKTWIDSRHLTEDPQLVLAGPEQLHVLGGY